MELLFQFYFKFFFVFFVFTSLLVRCLFLGISYCVGLLGRFNFGHGLVVLSWSFIFFLFFVFLPFGALRVYLYFLFCFFVLTVL